VLANYNTGACLGWSSLQFLRTQEPKIQQVDLGVTYKGKYVKNLNAFFFFYLLENMLKVKKFFYFLESFLWLNFVLNNLARNASFN
jgi:hypothetical protein